LARHAQVVHLKRFSFSAFRRTKLTTAVKCPLRGFSLDAYLHDACTPAALFTVSIVRAL
jgi:hypothetical protein